MLIFALLLSHINPLCEMLLDYSSSDGKVTVTIVNKYKHNLNGWLVANYGNTSIKKHVNINKTKRFEFPIQNRISFILSSRRCLIRRSLKINKMDKVKSIATRESPWEIIITGKGKTVYNSLKDEEGLIFLAFASLFASMSAMWKG